LLERGARLTELLKQGQYSPLVVEEQVVVIFAGVKGYLDTINKKDVVEFERRLLEEMRGHHKELLNTIRSGKTLTPEIEAKLKAILDQFVKVFAA